VLAVPSPRRRDVSRRRFPHRDPRPSHKVDWPRPDSDYVYAAVHDAPVRGRHGADGAAGSCPLRFTSFGDQSTRRWTPWSPAHSPRQRGSPSAGDITTAVEARLAVFHLGQRDLCYANLSHDASDVVGLVRNNSRSRANRPWMPAAGNHENELGNGRSVMAPTSLLRASDSGSDSELRGLWYGFHRRVGPGDQPGHDDVCYQGRWQTRMCALLRRCQSIGSSRNSNAPERQWHRLDRGVHAPDRGVDGRAHQRRGPGHPGELAATLRPLRRRPRGLRTRSINTTHPRGSGHPADRHADADPGRRAIGPHRHQQGTVHLVIRRWGHVDRVEQDVSFPSRGARS